jgi:hypothetical protein
MSERYPGGFITKAPVAPAGPCQTGAASGIWTLDQATQYIKAGTWPTAGVVPGSQSYTSAGTYTWVAPAAVTSVSVVAVGGGGGNSSYGGGGGGGLGYINSYSVTPGSSYAVQVGSTSGICATANASYFVSTAVVRGGGGVSGNSTGAGGTYTGTGGGNGGHGATCYSGVNPNGANGGGGAGGYSGTGGNGGNYGGACSTGGVGSGGSGGGGRTYPCCCTTFSPGGGVGIFGQGASGAHFGGNGGGNGSVCGGRTPYGGGQGSPGAPGGYSNGAVRIVWPGTTRTFPSTNVGSP